MIGLLLPTGEDTDNDSHDTPSRAPAYPPKGNTAAQEKREEAAARKKLGEEVRAQVERLGWSHEDARGFAISTNGKPANESNLTELQVLVEALRYQKPETEEETENHA